MSSITSAPSNGSTFHSNGSDTSISSIRATKRKFDDAIQNLDEAVRSTHSLDRPSPSKKPNTTPRSLYSTLAKYGIKTKEPKPSIDSDLSKTAPHLAAILARTATRTRKALPFKAPGRAASNLTPVNSTSEYRPSSIPSFLSRLATFKLSTYANKPAAIDAVAAAKCGWINDDKDRLRCGICDASWVVVGREGMNRDAANTLIEKQRVSLVEMHKDGCPWKTKQCDPSIYRIPLQAPAVMARDIKSNAIKLEAVLHDVEVKHPLTSMQTSSLRSTLSSVTVPTPSISEGEPPPTPTTADWRSSPAVSDTQPSETAILTSLFGWTLAPPPPERERPRTPSLSRAASILSHTPSMSRAHSMIPSAPSSPSVSRAQSVALSLPGDGESTPVRQMLRLGSAPPNTPRIPGTNRDTSLLYCVLCQRRVGLWAFAPPTPCPSIAAINGDGHSPPTPRSKRQFDLLKEHRSYCPYVVRSTVVPSMPTPVSHARTSSSSLTQLNTTNGAIEGWRAVLSVVLKYGIGQRQRVSSASYLERAQANLESSSSAAASGTTQEQDGMEVDGIEAMMAGVKSRGGKELLKYVKGLLA